jgi:hypothetical protein
MGFGKGRPAVPKDWTGGALPKKGKAFGFCGPGAGKEYF